MNNQQENDEAAAKIMAQIRALEDFIDDLLRENKAENRHLIALLLEDIRKRNTVH